MLLLVIKYYFLSLINYKIKINFTKNKIIIKIKTYNGEVIPFDIYKYPNDVIYKLKEYSSKFSF